jgi:hypothetical protein
MARLRTTLKWGAGLLLLVVLIAVGLKWAGHDGHAGREPMRAVHQQAAGDFRNDAHRIIGDGEGMRALPDGWGPREHGHAFYKHKEGGMLGGMVLLLLGGGLAFLLWRRMKRPAWKASSPMPPADFPWETEAPGHRWMHTDFLDEWEKETMKKRNQKEDEQ